MKQQILIIHGGDAFNSYDEYLNDLTTKQISLDRLRAAGWKDKLQSDLGDEFDVLMPRFPNGQNAKYAEWEIWFNKIIPLLDEEVILIGHSLGGWRRL